MTTGNRVQHFLDSDRAAWYNHVNLTAHEHGGHFIPWEIPGQWVEDLRRTFRGRARLSGVGEAAEQCRGAGDDRAVFGAEGA